MKRKSSTTFKGELLTIQERYLNDTDVGQSKEAQDIYCELNDFKVKISPPKRSQYVGSMNRHQTCLRRKTRWVSNSLSTIKRYSKQLYVQTCLLNILAKKNTWRTAVLCQILLHFSTLLNESNALRRALDLKGD